MLQAAENVNGVWVIVSKSRVDPYRLDQKTWTESEAEEKGLYSDTLRPFDAKPVPGPGEKLGIATVIDGRVVWPLVAKSAAELAAEALAEDVSALAACQCTVNGRCMMMPALDKLFAQGTLNLETIDPAFAAVYTEIKELQAAIDGAAE